MLYLLLLIEFTKMLFGFEKKNETLFDKWNELLYSVLSIIEICNKTCLYVNLLHPGSMWWSVCRCVCPPG